MQSTNIEMPLRLGTWMAFQYLSITQQFNYSPQTVTLHAAESLPWTPLASLHLYIPATDKVAVYTTRSYRPTSTLLMLYIDTQHGWIMLSWKIVTTGELSEGWWYQATGTSAELVAHFRWKVYPISVIVLSGPTVKAPKVPIYRTQAN